MFFKIRDLELRKIHFDVNFPPGEIGFDVPLRQAGDLHAEGAAELLQTAIGEVRVKGHLRVPMTAECDRCLEPVPVPVDTDFDLFYRPLEAGPAQEEISLDADESEVGFYEGPGLALADVVREQVLLSMPMRQICEEACKGICPVCGENRNAAPCGCDSKPVDDRWAALRDLRSGSR